MGKMILIKLALATLVTFAIVTIITFKKGKQKGLNLKRLFTLAASVLMLATLFSCQLMSPQKELLNLKSVETAETLSVLLKDQNNFYRNDLIYQEFALDGAVSLPQADAKTSSRDHFDTNNQVDGILEADIIKTDGHKIYYLLRTENVIKVFLIGVGGLVAKMSELDLGDLYSDSIYLTADYLIVIGYRYQETFHEPNSLIRYWPFFRFYQGVISVYDKNDLSLLYELTTDSNFLDYRLIDDALFIIARKNFQGGELRPTFIEKTDDGEERTSYLDYDDIYYFPELPSSEMTIFLSLDLKTFKKTTTAILSGVNHIYANEDHLYTSYSFYDYDNDERFLGVGRERTQILKFKIDTTEAQLTYLAAGLVNGFLNNQYWMDEDNGYLRLVTTSYNPIKNRLYVLKEEKETDNLITVGEINEGLGKPNENVYSVDFHQDSCYVVTFERIDPRYLVDLSDPFNPTIVSAVERPGYSTYLHIWNESGSQVVGFGFSADENGVINGMELLAADDTTGIEASYKLPYQDENDHFYYSYSEASYNPKAFLISPQHGIIAFPLNSYGSDKLKSSYLIFSIDFESEDIIKAPLIINHPLSDYQFPVERGVYLSESGENPFEIIYTFSNQALISYDLINKEIKETIRFKPVLETIKVN